MRFAMEWNGEESNACAKYPRREGWIQHLTRTK